jgi:hypothetical protein
MTRQTSQPAQPGNELYFTAGTKRAARIGRTMVVVTDGARIEITLPVRDGEATAITVTRDPDVKVANRVRKPAAVKPQASKPAAKPQAARKQPAGAAK